MANKILIVEEDPGLVLTLTDRLESEGFDTNSTDNSGTAFRLAIDGNYSLILLDIMLKGKSGFDICSKLRSAGCKTPILMLTARSQTADKITGLKLGADDYLTKPFNYSELLARIEALIRRSSNYPELTGVQKIGDLQIDLQGVEVYKSGARVDLTTKEFQLLKYLLINRGRLVTRDEILNEVWGYGESPSTRTIDTHIGWLRQKLEDDPKKPVRIITVHGFGYKFCE